LSGKKEGHANATGGKGAKSCGDKRKLERAGESVHKSQKGKSLIVKMKRIGWAPARPSRTPGKRLFAFASVGKKDCWSKVDLCSSPGGKDETTKV